jgi:DNA invertase Pin-like site-specific DNA recombinase
MKVALYARVSTRDKQNLDVQLRELRRYSASRGFKIASIVTDKASGSTDDRVGLKRILGLVREKKIDGVGVLNYWKQLQDDFAKKLKISIRLKVEMIT